MVKSFKSGKNENSKSVQSFEIINDGAQTIMSSKPGILVDWGLTIFFVVFCILLSATYFISYPETIQAGAKLTSINAPKPVVSQIAGKLVSLKVDEGTFVNKGQILGFIEANGDHATVLKLSNDVDSIQMWINHNKTENIIKYFGNSLTNLGELQLHYQEFINAFLTFQNYMPSGLFTQKKVLLSNDMESLNEAIKILALQQSLQGEDLLLAQQTFDANEALNNSKVISDFDFRAERSKLIHKKLAIPQLHSAIINNRAQLNGKRTEILELENSISQQHLRFQVAINTFNSNIDEWIKKYCLLAPTSGKVAFAYILEENQQLQAGQVLCYVNPQNSTYFGVITVPQYNFGKIALGQQVILKFKSHPFQEYGVVRGYISFISNVPIVEKDVEGYLVKVALPKGLTTSYDNVIQYRDGLLADAEIVTKDMKLIERFYYNVVKQLNISNKN